MAGHINNMPKIDNINWGNPLCRRCFRAHATAPVLRKNFNINKISWKTKGEPVRSPIGDNTYERVEIPAEEMFRMRPEVAPVVRVREPCRGDMRPR